MKRADRRWPAGRPPALATWRLRRETHGGQTWLCLELAALDGVRASAWAADAEGLSDAIALELRADGASSRPHDEPSDDGVCPHLRLVARGLVASAKVDLQCSRHGVPRALWLGGAVRSEIRATLPVVFERTDQAGRAVEIASERARIREAASMLGIAAFAIHDASTDIALIAHTVAAIRDAAGPGAALFARLSGQLDAIEARALLARIRPCDVICVADPCATVALNIDAARDGLPALGLSVARYERGALLAALAGEAPPAVLIVDPILEGGPRAVHELASIARVLQIDLCLTAEAGDAWLIALCADLAGVSPASHQPIELPPGQPLALLRALGLRAGALRPSSTVPLARAAQDALDPWDAGDAAVASHPRS